jgi:putative ABC transport system permease protein
MYKVYFKQAVQMLKQNRFISAIAVAGTALAIMMIMTIAVTDTIKDIDLTPEVNRSRMLYVDSQMTIDTTGGKHSTMSSDIYYSFCKEKSLLELKTPKQIAFASIGNTQIVQREGSREKLGATVRATDDVYWEVMSFSFLAGKPFGKEEFQSGVKAAVLSESMSRKLFGGDDPIGQTVEIQFIPFRVIGVVRDVSPVFTLASGDIWAPVTAESMQEVLGTLMLLAHDKSDFPAIINEVRNAEYKSDIADPPRNLWIKGPYTHKEYQMKHGNYQSREEEKQQIQANNRKAIMIFVLLLLIPAINLTGFSLSQMKKRRMEIGTRKAFGAKRRVILLQILCENMLTSFIGGITGLLLSYAMVFRLRHWLLGIPEDGSIPVEALLSLPVLATVFAVCVLLNLLSAGIPAYRTSRMNIVDSITLKEKQS